VYGVLGGVAFIVAIVGLLFLPQGPGDHIQELERNGYTSGFRVFGLIKVPSVPLMGFAVFSTAVSVGFLYVTLSPLLFEVSEVTHRNQFINGLCRNGGTAGLHEKAQFELS